MQSSRQGGGSRRDLRESTNAMGERDEKTQWVIERLKVLYKEQLSKARVEREETVEVRREKVVKKISCIESPSPRFTLSAFETMFPDKPRQKIVLELCSGQAHFSQMVDADDGA